MSAADDTIDALIRAGKSGVPLDGSSEPSVALGGVISGHDLTLAIRQLSQDGGALSLAVSGLKISGEVEVDNIDVNFPVSFTDVGGGWSLRVTNSRTAGWTLAGCDLEAVAIQDSQLTVKPSRNHSNYAPLVLHGCTIALSVRLNGSVIHGPVVLTNMTVEGDLSIVDSKVFVRGEVALDISRSKFGGIVVLGPRSEVLGGNVNADRVMCGGVRVDGALVRSPNGLSFAVTESSIRGDFAFGNEADTETLYVANTRILGNFDINDTILGCGGRAVHLYKTFVGKSVRASLLEMEGTFSIIESEIRGPVVSAMSRFVAHGQGAIRIEGCKILSDLRFGPDISADGAIELCNSSVAGQVSFDDARIQSAGNAIVIDSSRVGGVRLTGPKVFSGGVLVREVSYHTQNGGGMSAAERRLQGEP